MNDRDAFPLPQFVDVITAANIEDCEVLLPLNTNLYHS